VLGVKTQHHIQVQLGHGKVFIFNMLDSLVKMPTNRCTQVFPQNEQRLQYRKKQFSDTVPNKIETLL
jgi:hypothetical protein